MLGILRKFEYQDYLAREETKHNTAGKQGKTKCVKCGYCCLKRPCCPTPDEFYKIAEYLKLTPTQALKKYFVIDSYTTDGTKFIFPAKTTQLDITARYIPSDRTFDKRYCVFFDKKKGCKIYSVRPQTAKVQQCWGKDAEPTNSIKKWEGFDFEKLGVASTDLEDNNNDYGEDY
ncbi:MAG: YkgJ family cysteine cluster protein [Dehalococcoidia bacterium]|nr:YkgJ family cysteine cluster protein [Dehalococcoidia bacterium]